MKSKVLEKKIENLGVESNIVEKLKKNDINFIKDIWSLKRRDLKNIGLMDNEIKKVIIKLELHGIDLNKKVY